ncbi:hypothetical protein TNCV_2461021 [Trichonephila clavipes]|nr:hypothetical protein TNCV_2461021 [Trichonephila clavipes]
MAVPLDETAFVKFVMKILLNLNNHMLVRRQHSFTRRVKRADLSSSKSSRWRGVSVWRGAPPQVLSFSLERGSHFEVRHQ